MRAGGVVKGQGGGEVFVKMRRDFHSQSAHTDVGTLSLDAK